MSQPKQRRDRHHFRPILHLRQFANKDGMVWTYSRDPERPPRQIHPRHIGVETGLYAPGAGPNPQTDEVEVWLGEEIDGPSVVPLQKLIRGELLSPDERARMARFIAAQDLRTPYAKNFLLTRSQNDLDRQMAAYTSDPERIRADILARAGTDIPVEEIRAYLERANGPAVSVEKPFWLDFMADHVEGSARRLYETGWVRIHAPTGLDFITSDLGIVKFFHPFKGVSPHAVGWWFGAEYWVMTLNSRVALALGPDVPNGAATAEREWTRNLNRTLAWQAERHSFSQQFHGFVVRAMGLRSTPELPALSPDGQEDER